jgi:gliding motility-associated-like protein
MGGIYYLELIDTSNGCMNIDSISILEDFDNPIITAGEDIFLDCEETETLLSASIEGNPDDFEITWSSTNGHIVNGINNLSPLVDELGRYYLQVFDPVSGCTSIDSVLVEGNPDGPQLAFLQIDSISCENDNNGMLSVTNVDGGTPPFTYTLNGNIVNQEGLFANLSPGAYRVNITDRNGCSLDTLVQLEEGVSMDINLEPSIILSRGDTTTIEAMINYPIDRILSVQWSPADGLSCPTCLVTGLTAIQPSQYSVTIINDLGCVAFANFRLIIDREVNVFVPNVFSPNGDNINDLITVYADDSVVRINNMMIFDRWGEKVFHNQDFAPNDIQAGWDGTLNGEPLNPAVFVYVIELEFDNGDVGSFSGDITLIK